MSQREGLGRNGTDAAEIFLRGWRTRVRNKAPRMIIRSVRGVTEGSFGRNIGFDTMKAKVNILWR